MSRLEHMGDLGKFAAGFQSWRKVIASVGDVDARWDIFHNAAADVAGFVSRGLDKGVAVDELFSLAEGQGLLELKGEDGVQGVLARAFEHVEPELVPDPIEELEQRTNGHARDALRAPAPIEPSLYVLPDPATIPKRCWLHGMHYMRKVVTATVAPGGFGKTTLALFEALSMVALGYRVWYVSGEDDRAEIDRRIAAHCKQRVDENGRITRVEITAADIKDRLFIDDKMTFPFKIAKSSRNGPEFDVAKLDAFELAIKQRKIDVVILDPFVSFHYLSENDTAAMDALIKRLGDICVRCDCGVELSHHVRKPGIGQYEITVYDARGAAAIVNAVRSCRVINQMTSTEAEQAKIDKPASYIRIDSGKRNMAPPEKARWFHLLSVKIANDDHVQAIEHYEFRPEQVTKQDDNWLILTMTSGTQYRADSRSPEWLGHIIAKHFNRTANTKGEVMWVNKQINIWMTPAHDRGPLLRKVTREDKDRKPRIFFELVEGNERSQASLGISDRRADDLG